MDGCADVVADNEQIAQARALSKGSEGYGAYLVCAIAFRRPARRMASILTRCWHSETIGFSPFFEKTRPKIRTPVAHIYIKLAIRRAAPSRSLEVKTQ